MVLYSLGWDKLIGCAMAHLHRAQKHKSVKKLQYMRNHARKVVQTHNKRTHNRDYSLKMAEFIPACTAFAVHVRVLKEILCDYPLPKVRVKQDVHHKKPNLGQPHRNRCCHEIHAASCQIRGPAARCSSKGALPCTLSQISDPRQISDAYRSNSLGGSASRKRRMLQLLQLPLVLPTGETERTVKRPADSKVSVLRCRSVQMRTSG